MSQSDSIQRFLFTDTNLRGELVHLNESYQTIMLQHGYPKAVQHLLGETLLSAVLMTATAKFDGLLTVQFENDGPVELLVAKCDNDLQVRGVAQWANEADPDQLAEGLSQGELVITLQEKAQTTYQSIVPLEQNDIATALSHYFLQSEQIPTHFHFAVNEQQAVGMMLQLLPLDETLNTPAETWMHAQQHLDQLSAELLLNSQNEEILEPFRALGDIRLLDEQPVNFNCPCNIERMQDAVVTMGEQEVQTILEENQAVVVTCEYCNHEYGFSRSEIEQIFQSRP